MSLLVVLLSHNHRVRYVLVYLRVSTSALCLLVLVACFLCWHYIDGYACWSLISEIISLLYRYCLTLMMCVRRDGSATLSVVKSFGKAVGWRPQDIAAVVQNPRK
jgi:uncharacterized membrane protein